MLSSEARYHYSGTCQGVVALNMEDGTLHRFQAASTILATGVLSLSLYFTSYEQIEIYILMLFCVYFRAMVEHTFLPPRPIHALEMVMPWLHVLGCHSRFFFSSRSHRDFYFKLGFLSRLL